VNCLEKTKVQSLLPQTAMELVFQPEDCIFEFLELHMQSS